MPDIVIWDSHPLALAAIPVQVYIDGIPQLKGTITSIKPTAFQHPPNVPDFTKERKETVEWEGLPPLAPKESKKLVISSDILFVNVSKVFERRMINGKAVIRRNKATVNMSSGGRFTVLVRSGRIVCIGSSNDACSSSEDASVDVVNLEGGVLAPGFTSFGSPLGLVEIRLEPSTNDGVVLDSLSGGDLKILEGEAIRAVDGLQFGGRNTL